MMDIGREIDIDQKVLKRITSLQNIVDRCNIKIGEILDEHLQEISELTQEQLEAWIESLPSGCWYKFNLLREYRIRSEKQTSR